MVYPLCQQEYTFFNKSEKEAWIYPTILVTYPFAYQFPIREALRYLTLNNCIKENI